MLGMDTILFPYERKIGATQLLQPLGVFSAKEPCKGSSPVVIPKTEDLTISPFISSEWSFVLTTVCSTNVGDMENNRIPRARGE